MLPKYTVALSGTIVDDGSGLGTVDVAIAGIQNGAPDGVALVSPLGVVEFLSYEGSFSATNGPAAGSTSQDIGVSENGGTPAGFSLQRVGNPITNTWVGAIPNTQGAVNPGTIIPTAGGGVAITYADAIAAGDCPQESTITRTWTATDACGNTTTGNAEHLHR